MRHLLFALSGAVALTLTACGTTELTSSMDQESPEKQGLRVATFNVSMEADNYVIDDSSEVSSEALTLALTSGTHPQIQNIAEIIQRTRPHIILLNEFDYIEDPSKGINLFRTNYLNQPQSGLSPIDYPYVYLAPVNTGVKTQLSDSNLSLFGFGKYPGQYAMVLLSQYPINTDQVRTFQNFLWKDMPSHIMPINEQGDSWYDEDAVGIMRLSSKSHWDVPINVCGETLHVLASHPTPPVFDGPEDRNGRRNFDEIRFWADYISPQTATYHYDDLGNTGGLAADSHFVILGDLNASSVEGDAYPGAMDQLLTHPLIANYPAPTSEGGKENRPESNYATTHTAYWGMRADYVLPSANLNVTQSGVYWPKTTDEEYRLVESRQASSDHRMVWVDFKIPIDKCAD